MNYLVKNGRVIDPMNKVDDILDIVISDGKVERIGKDLKTQSQELIDAKGRIVAPGLVDMHAHLREPGREDEETVLTGTRAAIRGGFTTILAMPNTEPAIDNAKRVDGLKEIIKHCASVNVLIAGAITEGREGKKLVDLSALKRKGAVAVSDDGSSVESDKLMADALREAKKAGLLLIEHCEDSKLAKGGVVNQGYISTKMGLKGIPRAAEYERVRRNLELAKKESAAIHIAHVSCKESVELIRSAKRAGIKVSAEAAPHHFALTEGCCVTYDTNTKTNPPLRTKEDVEAVKNGLADGTIDAIATDHAPHTDSEKDVEFDYAPFGIIGLETALSLAVMELVDTKALSWPELILKMSANPARILGIERGTIAKGAAADIVIIDPAREYVYKKGLIESKSKNSPFVGWKLKAKVTHVFVGGKLVMENEAIGKK